MIKSIDKNGVVTSVSYVNKTSLPDVITKTKSGVASEGTDFTYNAFGNVTTKKDLLTQKQTGYTYTYDQKPLTVVDNGKTMTYTYDNNNYLHSVTDYFNNVSTYTYNAVGQVTGISRGNDTYQYAYTPRGYLQSETRGGITTEYAYTNVGLLSSLTNKTVDNTLINSYNYTYDMVGNQLSKTETKGNASIVESYTYDSIGRLESVTAGDELTEYLYDANGNRSTQTVTTDGVQNLVIEYDYDLQNRLTEQISQRNGETEHKKYAYDNNGNLYSEMTSVVKADAGLTEYSIGEIGDVAQFPAVKLYRYNLSNQLVSYQDDNGTKATYAYNPDGMRSSKTVNGNTTSYYYNGMYAVNEEQNGELTATNILGINGIIGRTAQGSTGYFVKNGHGDVISARTADGTTLGDYDYDPWGNSTLADGTWDNPIRYAGEYTDDETGLIYLRARYYDSGIGRFISEDPVKDGLNWYVYCGNNPIAFVDPSGLSSSRFVVSEDPLNMRSGAGTDNSVIMQLQKGTEVTYTGNKTTKEINNHYWAEVTYNNTTGWVAADYLGYEHPDTRAPWVAIGGHGVYVGKVATGGNHTATILFADPSSQLVKDNPELFCNTITRSDGVWSYCTMGAYSTNGGPGGYLFADNNYKGDVAILTGTAKNDWWSAISCYYDYEKAVGLITINNNFITNHNGELNYFATPTANGNSWNSNSYTFSILSYSGGCILPDLSSSILPGGYPGWGKLIPREMFD